MLGKRISVVLAAAMLACGTERVSATAGTAFLTASGDGINAEKIKWDTDPERLYLSR